MSRRPRVAAAIAFALAVLGAADGAGAAELGFDPAGLLLAQSASVIRGPGMYLNLFKFLPVLVLYLMWVWTTFWIHDDTQDLNNVRAEMWNSIAFFTGLLGFALVW